MYIVFNLLMVILFLWCVYSLEKKINNLEERITLTLETLFGRRYLRRVEQYFDFSDEPEREGQIEYIDFD